MAATRTRPDLPRLIHPMTDRKLVITVLAGGPSGERAVSLESGKAVAAALQSLGHTVHLEDIAPDNLKALARTVDCVFVALHGPFGEDGQVQAILENRGLRYCGSGPDACALAMHKVRAKQRFLELGLPTPRFLVADAHTDAKWLDAWPLPAVAKPVAEGSSLACHIIRERSHVRPAVDDVIARYGDCLLEEFIPGKELTVGILVDRPLPAIEIRTRREFYDYQAKYVDEDTVYAFDIDLPGELLKRVGEMSLAAHQGLGCRDFSRVDWRVNPASGEACILEINVIPGLTSHSLLPKAAAQTGLSMPQMCQRLVEQALNRPTS